ncbi:MAG: YceD family protein [Suilimivivens sp.]
MLINLTDVFTSEGKVKKLSVSYDQESYSYMGSDFPVSDKSDIAITLTNIGTGCVLVEGNLELTLTIPCDRCLQSVMVPLSVAFTHQVLSPEKEDAVSEEEDQNFVSGYELDTEALINNEILINMPVKVLCREDCKGICPVCGHNLNEGECGCDRFVPDPRMAAIKDIFNANKEV